MHLRALAERTPQQRMDGYVPRPPQQIEQSRVDRSGRKRRELHHVADLVQQRDPIFGVASREHWRDPPFDKLNDRRLRLTGERRDRTRSPEAGMPLVSPHDDDDVRRGGPVRGSEPEGGLERGSEWDRLY